MQSARSRQCPHRSRQHRRWRDSATRRVSVSPPGPGNRSCGVKFSGGQCLSLTSLTSTGLCTCTRGMRRCSGRSSAACRFENDKGCTSEPIARFGTSSGAVKRPSVKDVAPADDGDQASPSAVRCRRSRTLQEGLLGGACVDDPDRVSSRVECLLGLIAVARGMS